MQTSGRSGRLGDKHSVSTGSVVAAIAPAVIFLSRSQTSAPSRISAGLFCPASSSRAPSERGVGAAEAEAHAGGRG